MKALSYLFEGLEFFYHTDMLLFLYPDALLDVYCIFKRPE